MPEPSPGFDCRNPPLHPPAGCLNRLMWQLARRLYADHQAGPDGWCVICRPFQFYPCVGRQLAEVGLLGSFTEPDGAPWRERQPVNRSHRW